MEIVHSPSWRGSNDGSAYSGCTYKPMRLAGSLQASRLIIPLLVIVVTFIVVMVDAVAIVAMFVFRVATMVVVATITALIGLDGEIRAIIERTVLSNGDKSWLMVRARVNGAD